MTTHGGRKQLAAKADSQHRLTREHGFADQRHFRPQVWELVGLVDVHRSAEHDEAVISANVGLCFRVAIEVHIFDSASRIPQQWIQMAEGLRRNVLKYQDLAQGLRLTMTAATSRPLRPF